MMLTSFPTYSLYKSSYTYNFLNHITLSFFLFSPVIQISIAFCMKNAIQAKISLSATMLRITDLLIHLLVCGSIMEFSMILWKNGFLEEMGWNPMKLSETNILNEKSTSHNAAELLNAEIYSPIIWCCLLLHLSSTHSVSSGSFAGLRTRLCRCPGNPVKQALPWYIRQDKKWLPLSRDEY